MNIMPQEEKLDIVFVIDRSGSMTGSESDTIGGFNSFIEREKKNELDTRVTVVLFDDRYEVLYTRKPIYEVSKLTEKEYWVRGSTALLDAIGKTINTLNHEIDNKVLFVIMTDGMENSSREYSKEQIRSLIKSHNWEFIFIGADIDSYAEARNIGIRRTRVANYKKSRRGFDDVFASVERAAYSMHNNMDLGEVEWNKDLKKYD